MSEIKHAEGDSRFFMFSNGNGFARFDYQSSRIGNLWVKGYKESTFSLAGTESHAWLERELVADRFREFSPAALLASVKSANRSLASRANGALGGRPRKKG